MAKERKVSESVFKQRHPSYRTLDELIFKPTKQIVNIFQDWSKSGVRLDPKSFNYDHILNLIPFSIEQLKKLEGSMKKGVTYLEEQGRKEDATTYERLANYFNKRIAFKKKR